MILSCGLFRVSVIMILKFSTLLKPKQTEIIKTVSKTVFDSTAKISSGILSGNINSFGDFDECLRSKSSLRNIGGKFCLTYVNIEVPDDMIILRKLKHLSHSLETFRGNFSRGLDDVSYFSLSNNSRVQTLPALSFHPNIFIISLVNLHSILL